MPAESKKPKDPTAAERQARRRKALADQGLVHVQIWVRREDEASVRKFDARGGKLQKACGAR